VGIGASNEAIYCLTRPLAEEGGLGLSQQQKALVGASAVLGGLTAAGLLAQLRRRFSWRKSLIAAVVAADAICIGLYGTITYLLQAHRIPVEGPFDAEVLTVAVMSACMYAFSMVNNGAISLVFDFVIDHLKARPAALWDHRPFASLGYAAAGCAMSVFNPYSMAIVAFLIAAGWLVLALSSPDEAFGPAPHRASVGRIGPLFFVLVAVVAAVLRPYELAAVDYVRCIPWAKDSAPAVLTLGVFVEIAVLVATPRILLKRASVGGLLILSPLALAMLYGGFVSAALLDMPLLIIGSLVLISINVTFSTAVMSIVKGQGDSEGGASRIGLMLGIQASGGFLGSMALKLAPDVVGGRTPMLSEWKSLWTMALVLAIAGVALALLVSHTGRPRGVNEAASSWGRTVQEERSVDPISV
jgi:MFS family permease